MLRQLRPREQASRATEEIYFSRAVKAGGQASGRPGRISPLPWRQKLLLLARPDQWDFIHRAPSCGSLCRPRRKRTRVRQQKSGHASAQVARGGGSSQKGKLPPQQSTRLLIEYIAGLTHFTSGAPRQDETQDTSSSCTRSRLVLRHRASKNPFPPYTTLS